MTKRGKRINICGIPHEVVECEDVFDADQMHLGQIEFKDAKILINRNIAPVVKEATICHEVLHGMLVHIGRDDLSNDEQFVTALGNAIYQAFNVRYLDEG